MRHIKFFIPVLFLVAIAAAKQPEVSLSLVKNEMPSDTGKVKEKVKKPKPVNPYLQQWDLPSGSDTVQIVQPQNNPEQSQINNQQPIVSADSSSNKTDKKNKHADGSSNENNVQEIGRAHV